MKGKGDAVFLWFVSWLGSIVTLRDNAVHRIVGVRDVENPAGTTGREFLLLHGGEEVYITDWATQDCSMTRTGQKPPSDRPLCPLCFPKNNTK